MITPYEWYGALKTNYSIFLMLNADRNEAVLNAPGSSTRIFRRKRLL
jgi:hypothetical protein